MRARPRGNLVQDYLDTGSAPRRGFVYQQLRRADAIRRLRSVQRHTACQPLTLAMLRNPFDGVREAAGVAKELFSIRGLRAKAATDA